MTSSVAMLQLTPELAQVAFTELNEPRDIETRMLAVNMVVEEAERSLRNSAWWQKDKQGFALMFLRCVVG